MTDEHQGNAVGCCGLFVLLILLWAGIIWTVLYLVGRLG